MVQLSADKAVGTFAYKATMLLFMQGFAKSHIDEHFKPAKQTGHFGAYRAKDGDRWKAVEKYYDELDLGRMMLAKVARRSDKLQSWVTKQGADFPFHASANKLARNTMALVKRLSEQQAANWATILTHHRPSIYWPVLDTNFTFAIHHNKLDSALFIKHEISSSYVHDRRVETPPCEPRSGLLKPCLASLQGVAPHGFSLDEVELLNDVENYVRVKLWPKRGEEFYDASAGSSLTMMEKTGMDEGHHYNSEGSSDESSDDDDDDEHEMYRSRRRGSTRRSRGAAPDAAPRYVPPPFRPVFSSEPPSIAYLHRLLKCYHARATACYDKDPVLRGQMMLTVHYHHHSPHHYHYLYHHHYHYNHNYHQIYHHHYYHH
jgi:hypothetical protein